MSAAAWASARYRSPALNPRYGPTLSFIGMPATGLQPVLRQPRQDILDRLVGPRVIDEIAVADAVVAGQEDHVAGETVGLEGVPGGHVAVGQHLFQLGVAPARRARIRAHEEGRAVVADPARK